MMDISSNLLLIADRPILLNIILRPFPPPSTVMQGSYGQNMRKQESCLEKEINNARCKQAKKTTHGLDGQHQDMDKTPRGRVNQNERRQR